MSTDTPYLAVREQIVEMYPDGQRLVDIIEKRHSVTEMEPTSHGAVQTLIRDVIAFGGNSAALSRLVAWGFAQQDHPDLINDFEVTTRPDQLLAAGYRAEQLDFGVLADVYDKNHFLHREALHLARH